MEVSIRARARKEHCLEEKARKRIVTLSAMFCRPVVWPRATLDEPLPWRPWAAARFGEGRNWAAGR
jgi:hypothetical protein